MQQCQIDKMSKISFKTKSYNFEEVLELVHTYLCGPICVESYCGDIYVIFFVDDYSKKMTVMFLNDKYDAFQNLKWYLDRVDKETGRI